jgi:hypothetical protein
LLIRKKVNNVLLQASVSFGFSYQFLSGVLCIQQKFFGNYSGSVNAKRFVDTAKMFQPRCLMR